MPSSRVQQPKPIYALRARRRRLRLVLVCAWLAVASTLPCLAAEGEQAEASPCATEVAVLSASEGSVEIQRDNSSEWRAVSTGEKLCALDTLRVNAASNAVVTLPDGSLVRLGENSTLRLPELSRGGTVVELLRGIMHIISRDPRQLRFTTPFANAGIEGTEFDIRVRAEAEQTQVTVLEGAVSVTTPSGDTLVPSGHTALARRGTPPTLESVARPIDTMRWTAYYPELVAGELPAPGQAPAPEVRNDPEFYARRAAAALRASQTDAAETDLARALELEPRHATALALGAIVALARADRATARRLVGEAVAAEPRSVAALIATSWVDEDAQAFDAATAAVREALEIEPDNGIALTRLAELELVSGNVAASLADAQRAAELRPRSGAPATVLGFAHLRRFDLTAAHAAFERAIEIAPDEPQPRLGLALTDARRGDLDEARRHLEAAVVNDPTNGLLRSYMAKVYDALDRYELGARQVELAREFDPLDPTAPLYGAFENLWANRPVEALEDLLTSTEQNGDQAVFRSRLPLEEDIGTRAAGRARVFHALGFPRLALLDAWDAVAVRPDDFAGYRLLADAYAGNPDEDIARVSALVVAQLLQPINVTPIKPQLARPTSFVTDMLAAGENSFTEFGSLLATGGPRLQISSLAAGNDTISEDVSIAGLRDRVAYSIGQYRLATDGFRDNNDLDERLANAFVQVRPDERTSLQAEVRAVRAESGHLAMPFDRSFYDPELRIDENTESVRLGGRRDLAPERTLLVSLIRQQSKTEARRPTDMVMASQDSYSVDTQIIGHIGKTRLQSGLGFVRQDEVTEASFMTPGFPSFSTRDADDRRHLRLYSYAQLRPTANLMLTLGASAERLRSASDDRDTLDPKLGLVWRPGERTTLRVAAFESLFSSLTTSRQNPQPRLEPVELAGFSQLSFGGTADHTRFKGIGLDHEFSRRLFLGAEVSDRRIARTVLLVDPVTPMIDVADRERTTAAYFYWTATDELSLTARYERGHYTSTPLELFGYSDMHIERTPLELRYFAPRGLTAGFRATRVDEHGLFVQGLPPALSPGEDRFWTYDAFVGYRLPNRRGMLSLNADNLLDERFQFQDPNPENLSIMPERIVSLRFTLAFD